MKEGSLGNWNRFSFSLGSCLLLLHAFFTADLPLIAKFDGSSCFDGQLTCTQISPCEKARLCSLIRIASLLIRDTPRANSKLTLTKSWIVFPSKTIWMIAASRFWFRCWVFVLKYTFVWWMPRLSRVIRYPKRRLNIFWTTFLENRNVCFLNVYTVIQRDVNIQFLLLLFGKE